MAIERVQVLVSVDTPPVALPNLTGQVLAVVGTAAPPAATDGNVWKYIELDDGNISANFGDAAGATNNSLSHPLGTELPQFLRFLRSKGVRACYAAAPVELQDAVPATTHTRRAKEVDLWESLVNDWSKVGDLEPTILTTFAEVISTGVGDDKTLAPADRTAANPPTTADPLVTAITNAARLLECRAIISTPGISAAHDLAWAGNNGDGRVLRVFGRAVEPFSPGPGEDTPVNAAPFVAASLMEKNYWQRIANMPVQLGPDAAELERKIGYGAASTTDSSRYSQAHISALVDLGSGYQLYGDRLGVPAGVEDDPRRFWHISHTMDYLTKYARFRYNRGERDEVGAAQFVTGYVHGVNDEIRRHTKPPRNNVIDSGEILVNQEESDANNLKFDMDIDFNTPAVDWEIRANITQ